MSLMTRSSTVDGIIRRSAKTSRDRPAVIFGDRTLTYAALDDAVTRAAAHLLDLGLTKGDRVAAYGKNSDAYLVGFLACARAGLVHVPLNYNLTGPELSYLVTQSGSRAILHDPALRDAHRACSTRSLDQLEHRIALRDAEESLIDVALSGDVPTIEVEVADTDTAQFLYTSGTTSRPKAAMMSHRALVHEYVSCIVALDLRRGRPAARHAALPLGSDARLPRAVARRGCDEHHPRGPRRGGGPPTDRAGRPPRLLRGADALGRDGQPRRLRDARPRRPRKAYYGASIMPVPVLQRIQAKALSLGFYNCFGQSEIAPLATVLRPEEHADAPGLGGPADPLRRDQGHRRTGTTSPRAKRARSSTGRRSCATATGTIPGRPRRRLPDGWFHSGDLVRIDEEGFIFVVDRIKDVINTGGVLVASREVEDALYTHPAVAEVAVVGEPDEKWVEAVTAFVVSKTEVTEADLVEHVRGSLASFKIPKRITFVETLPRNASGKILKRELRGSA